MKLSQRTLFSVTGLYYVALLLMPDTKTLVAVSVLFFLFLWKLFGSLRIALGSIYLMLLPIAVGKKIPIEFLSPLDLDILGRSYGISADVIISLPDIVIAGMGIVLVLSALRGTLVYRRDRWLELLLFLYPVATILATLFGSVHPEVSILHSLFTVRPLILYYFFASFSGITPLTAITFMSAGVVFESFVVGGQVVRGGPLELAVEAYRGYISIDSSAEAGTGLLRYAGTYEHANVLAHALLVPLTLLLPTLFYRYGNMGKILSACFFVGLGALAWTMSRSAYVGLGVGVGIFFFIAEKIWHYRLTMVHIRTALTRGMIAAIIIGIGAIMLPRITSSWVTGNAYGSWETRMLLLREYKETIAQHLVNGVGLGMDVYYQYQRSFIAGDPQLDSPNRSVLQYFPEPVHNGFIRLLVQVGLLGTVAYSIVFVRLFLLTIMRVRSKRGQGGRLLGLSLVITYIAVFINSMAQPLLPDLQFFVVLTMIYAHNRV